MIIEDNQLAQPSKKIGKLGKDPVYYSLSKGGWHIITTVGVNGKRTIGLGGHKGLATLIASKQEPSIEFTELSKSDHVEYSALEPFVDKYEKILSDIQKLEQ